MKPLRPIQAKAIEQVKLSLARGNKRIVLKAPTGAGKTVIAAHIIQGALDKGKRVIFCVNAISLVDQTVQRFWADGIQAIGVIQGAHEMTDYRKPVQVCSIQTLQRRNIPVADLVIVDECFPADTMIDTPRGKIPIQLVSSGDIVYTAVGLGVVKSRSVKMAECLVEVLLDDGTKLECTNNHPIFTERGWKKAGELAVGEALVSRKEMPGLHDSVFSENDLFKSSQQGNSFDGKTIFQASDLLALLLQEIEEPNAFRGIQEKNVKQAGGDRAQTKNKGWEWERNDPRSVLASESFGGWLYSRICREHWNGQKANGVSIPLQDRHSKSCENDSNRGGRRIALLSGEEASGCEKGQLFSFPRVVSISHKESGGGTVVYNLSVSGHPSFFADGILAHNCHNWFQFYGEWMQDWNLVPFIGLSATPYTKGLGKYYQDMVIAATTQELIDMGWLSPFRVYAPSHPDMKGVRTTAGDYNESDLEKAMDVAPLTADIVETWLKRGENRPTLCYGVTRVHAKHLQESFERAGVPCGYIDSYTEIEERRELAAQFADGRLKIICNVGVLTTGIDWDVRCIILARPTKSDILFQQIIGRGLRTAEGKADLIVLDHSDTHLRLGFVTDIDSQYDTLCDGNPKPKADSKKEILPKECGKCHFLKPPKMQICPACGFKAEPVNKTETADGDLSELHQKKANKTMTNSQKEVFFAELRKYGMDRGYKEGWASNKYREKTGVWPNKINHIAPRQPSMETLSFIQHLNIKAAYGNKPKKEKKVDPFPIDKAAVAAMERRKREAGERALKESKIWAGFDE